MIGTKFEERGVSYTQMDEGLFTFEETSDYFSAILALNMTPEQKSNVVDLPFYKNTVYTAYVKASPENLTIAVKNEKYVVTINGEVESFDSAGEAIDRVDNQENNIKKRSL